MTIKILNGDVMDHLKELPDNSIHCVCTSPPYWGLRDYGVDGQIGLEKTPEEYTQKMVGVFREVRRVMRDDGTLWLNLGDSYIGGGRGGKEQCGKGSFEESRYENGMKIGLPTGKIDGLKQKDLVGIPWRVAFALQADGWYLRSDIIWSKPNPMPESVTDRPTKAHEYLFLLTKQARYYYDADAIRETSITPWHGIGGYREGILDNDYSPPEYRNDARERGGRNRRTVWEIATQPTPEAHFATYPEALVEPCIKAGTSERGCCPVCESPWERVIEVEGISSAEFMKGKEKERFNSEQGRVQNIRAGDECFNRKSKTLGWQPTCTCNQKDTVPCTVLDPFGGSGTTGLVARNLKRDAILIELNPEYVKIMKKKPRLNEQLVVA
jgi:DNA modification methylase